MRINKYKKYCIFRVICNNKNRFVTSGVETNRVDSMYLVCSTNSYITFGINNGKPTDTFIGFISIIDSVILVTNVLLLFQSVFDTFSLHLLEIMSFQSVFFFCSGKLGYFTKTRLKVSHHVIETIAWKYLLACLL